MVSNIVPEGYAAKLQDALDVHHRRRMVKLFFEIVDQIRSAGQHGAGCMLGQAATARRFSVVGLK